MLADHCSVERKMGKVHDRGSLDYTLTFWKMAAGFFPFRSATKALVRSAAVSKPTEV